MPAVTLPALLLAAAAIAWSEELGGEPVEDEQAAELSAAAGSTPGRSRQAVPRASAAELADDGGLIC